MSVKVHCYHRAISTHTHTEREKRVHMLQQGSGEQCRTSREREIRRRVMPPQRDCDITVVSVCSLSPHAGNRLA